MSGGKGEIEEKLDSFVETSYNRFNLKPDQCMSKENAKKLMELKRQEDELEDRIEFGAFIATGGRDKKHTFTHNGRKFER